MGLRVLVTLVQTPRPDHAVAFVLHQQEWNLMNLEELDATLEQQLKARGLQVEIPEVSLGERMGGEKG